MRRRFGAWMYRSRRVLTVVTVVAGLLILLIAHAEFPGIWITYWQNQAQPCGTVGYSGARGGSDGDPQAATTCFLQAYTQCHAATLFESLGDVNTRSWDTYLIEPPLLAAGGHSHRATAARGWRSLLLDPDESRHLAQKCCAGVHACLGRVCGCGAALVRPALLRLRHVRRPLCGHGAAQPVTARAGLRRYPGAAAAPAYTPDLSGRVRTRRRDLLFACATNVSAGLGRSYGDVSGGE